jgi:hypothetical protein
MQGVRIPEGGVVFDRAPKGKGSSIRSRVALVVRRGCERVIEGGSGGSQRVRKSD